MLQFFIALIRWCSPALVLCSCEVFAQQATDVPPFRYGYKDWAIIEESVDPYLKVPSCRAYTRTSSDSPVQLSLSFPHNYLKAPVAMISLSPDFAGQRIQIRMTSGQTELALPLENLTSPEGVTYWYIPMEMDLLIHEINNANNLEIAVQFEDKKETPLKISLAGSLRTLQVVTKCLGKTDLYLKKFFEELNDPSVETLPVSGEISSLRLQEFFHMSYGLFLSKKGIEEDLEKLREKNKDTLLGEAQAQEKYDQTKAMLTAAQTALTSLNNEEQKLNNSLYSLNMDLSDLRKQLKTAEGKYLALKQSFNPLQTQADQFRYKISSEQNTLSALDNKIRSEQDDVSKAIANTSRLEGELNLIKSEVQKLNEELAGLGNDRTALGSQLAGIDVEKEVKQKLENSQEYRSASAEIEKRRAQLTGLEGHMRQAQVTQIHTQREFEGCRRKNATLPGPNPCVAEMEALRKAQSEFSRLQREVRQVNTEITGFEIEIRELRRNFRQVVMKEWNRIKRELTAVERNIARRESEVAKRQERISKINIDELPSYREEIKSSQAQLESLASQRSAALDRFSSLQFRFEEFRSVNNYDQIHQNFAKAGQAFQSLKDQEVAIETKMARASERLKTIATEKPLAKTLIANRTLSRDQAEADFKNIQNRLKEYRLSEDQFNRGINYLTQQYNLSRGHYRFLLLELAKD